MQSVLLIAWRHLASRAVRFGSCQGLKARGVAAVDPTAILGDEH